MSMTLQDEMALTIRRAILAKKPGECPPDLVLAAQIFEESYQNWRTANEKYTHRYDFGDATRERTAYYTWRTAYENFKDLLAEHADELRAICTENE